MVYVCIGIYEDQQIHTTNNSLDHFNAVSPILVLIGRHLIIMVIVRMALSHIDQYKFRMRLISHSTQSLNVSRTQIKRFRLQKGREAFEHRFVHIQ